MLTIVDWERLDKMAAKREWSRARLISEWVKGNLQVTAALERARPGVYYDAQGREHEHGDVTV